MPFVLKLTRPKPFVIKVGALICPPTARLKVLKWKGSERLIYMIRETESMLDDSKLRPTELAKIKSAKRHFEAIGIDDYARAAPGKWSL